MKYLIVNADDFGASAGINRGILEAHERGVLTSTSLMVNMPAVGEAVRSRRDYPELSIGLHVNFTGESDGPVVDIDDTEACRAELARQFDQFGDVMGCLPSHLDSHHHVHRRRNLLPLFQDLASRHQLPLREHSPVRFFKKFYAQWDDDTHLDWIATENLIQLLAAAVVDGITELGCHPGYVDPVFATLYNTEREVELQTLCDPKLRAWLTNAGVALVNYHAASSLADAMAS